MGLFRKNPNESAYTGGQKHWADVIKNTGIGGDLVWRQPEEDFNTNSTLIVNPGEQAVFIKGGVIQEVFDNGTYQLSTENYPFISRLRNAFTGGISTFNCFVYFVRTASSVEIKWGTDSPIQVRDPLTKMRTELLARGAYRIKIGNAGVFLHKTLGNNIDSFSPEEIKDYCDNEFLEQIKTRITQAVENSGKEILGISGRQIEISKAIEPVLHEIMEDAGIELLKFSIAAIDIADTQERAKFENAMSDRAVMDVLGDRWQAQQQVDIMKTMAANPHGSAGAEIGMGMAAGAAFFGMGQQFMQQQQQQPQQVQQAPPPVTPPPMVQYYIFINNQQVGPMNMSQMAAYVNSGQLNQSTLVWRDGMPQWAAAGSLAELAQLFAPATPPMPPTPPIP